MVSPIGQAHSGQTVSPGPIGQPHSGQALTVSVSWRSDFAGASSGHAHSEFSRRRASFSSPRSGHIACCLFSIIISTGRVIKTPLKNKPAISEPAPSKKKARVVRKMTGLSLLCRFYFVYLNELRRLKFLTFDLKSPVACSGSTRVSRVMVLPLPSVQKVRPVFASANLPLT